MANDKDSGERSDGSRKHILRGGPFDGMKVRVYPDYHRDKGVKHTTWEGLNFGDRQYVQPDPSDQDPTKRYLMYVQPA